MKMMNIFKKLKKYIKIYLSLAHIKVLIIIIFLSTIAFCLSVYYLVIDSFVSSLFANIFAGLITGIVLYLISSVKSISLYRTECLINWLNNIHEDYLKYNEMHYKLISYKEDDFVSKEELYEFIYDVLCFGHNINVKIIQSQFDKSLPFDSYKYFKNSFNYDAIEQIKIDKELGEKIMSLSIADFSKTEIRDIFRDMNYTLSSLNSDIFNKIKDLEIKKKIINTALL
ncbi:MAG: hypothetical protein KHY19_14195 [Coprobacillus cateniformis]|nr:hypothetical protein [Coprobacillus cateniformis]